MRTVALLYPLQWQLWQRVPACSTPLRLIDEEMEQAACFEAKLSTGCESGFNIASSLSRRNSRCIAATLNTYATHQP